MTVGERIVSAALEKTPRLLRIPIPKCHWAGYKVSHTAAGLLLGLLGLGLLLPLGLSLLDQALLACVLMLDLCALRNGVERRLVVNTVDKTGDESRVAEDLSIRKVVNVRSRMG